MNPSTSSATLSGCSSCRKCPCWADDGSLAASAGHAARARRAPRSGRSTPCGIRRRRARRRATVRSVIASRGRRDVGAQVGPDGHAARPRRRGRCAAFSNAACAVSGSTICGRSSPRAVAVAPCIASMIDSVPPEDTMPTISSSVRSAPSMSRGHRDDLGLELRRARPQVDVQRVALRVQRVGPREELDVLGVAVVDGAGRVALLPARALGARPSPRARRAPPRAARPVCGQALERGEARRGRAQRRDDLGQGVGHSWRSPRRGRPRAGGVCSGSRGRSRGTPRTARRRARRGRVGIRAPRRSRRGRGGRSARSSPSAIPASSAAPRTFALTGSSTWRIVAAEHVGHDLRPQRRAARRRRRTRSGPAAAGRSARRLLHPAGVQRDALEHGARERRRASSRASRLCKPPRTRWSSTGVRSPFSHGREERRRRCRAARSPRAGRARRIRRAGRQQQVAQALERHARGLLLAETR